MRVHGYGEGSKNGKPVIAELAQKGEAVAQVVERDQVFVLRLSHLLVSLPCNCATYMVTDKRAV